MCVIRARFPFLREHRGGWLIPLSGRLIFQEIYFFADERGMYICICIGNTRGGIFGEWGEAVGWADGK